MLHKFCDKHDPEAIDISETYKNRMHHTGQENMTREELEIVRNIWVKTEGMYIKPYYVDRVLSLGEHNGYNDSDFYAMVWDDETESIKKVIYATTRGWSYPLYGAEIDATPEIQEKAKEYTRKRDRHYRAKMLCRARAEYMQLAKDMRLKNRHEVKKLKFAVGSDYFDSVCTLLKVKNFRSKFRESLANQVRSWLSDPEPKYNTPLSRKQLSYLY